MREVDRIVAQHADWVRAEQARLAPPLSPADKARLAKQAKDRICERIALFAPRLGSRLPARVTIREQKNALGELFPQGEPELQLEADSRAARSVGLCGGA